MGRQRKFRLHPALQQHPGGPVLQRFVVQQLEKPAPHRVADLVDIVLLQQVKGGEILQHGDARVGHVEIGPLRGVEGNLRNGLGNEVLVGLVV
ncbi:hypothetical protein SDC9_78197 [bioreactor metagenome]|uniref:Uncharacterized protein n=1 Tax=bioreactor metagenome TaxID=1076179 RepID=A0A644YUW6_9ZZZZ